MGLKKSELLFFFFPSGSDYKFRKPRGKRSRICGHISAIQWPPAMCFKGRDGASVFLSFILFFSPLPFPSFVPYQSMWRDADYSAESSQRRSSVTARRRARKEERSGKFNPNKWHLGVEGGGKRRRALASAARPTLPPPPPRACTRLADRGPQ